MGLLAALAATPVTDTMRPSSAASNPLLTAPIDVDARHISHKQGVVAVLRGYTETEVETLSEESLDGILRDYRSAHVLDAIIESRKDTAA